MRQLAPGETLKFLKDSAYELHWRYDADCPFKLSIPHNQSDLVDSIKLLSEEGIWGTLVIVPAEPAMWMGSIVIEKDESYALAVTDGPTAELDDAAEVYIAMYWLRKAKESASKLPDEPPQQT